MENHNHNVTFFVNKTSKHVLLENMIPGVEHHEELFFSTDEVKSDIIVATSFYKRIVTVAKHNYISYHSKDEILIDLNERVSFVEQEVPEIQFENLPTHVKALYKMRFS